MTDPHEPDLDALDRAARAASRGLHAHVDRQVDPSCMLAALPAARRRARDRGRLLAAAAVAALFIGSVAVLGDGPRRRRALAPRARRGRQPAARRRSPASLTPLGPNDGRDSIQLPDHGGAERRPARRRQSSPSPARASSRRAGRHRPVRQRGRRRRWPRAARRHRRLRHRRRAVRRRRRPRAWPAGTFTVRRVLTTPATGTVDCAARSRALHRRHGCHHRLRPLRRLRRGLRGWRRADRHPDRRRSRPPRGSPTATSCTSTARASSPTARVRSSVCSHRSVELLGHRRGDRARRDDVSGRGSATATTSGFVDVGLLADGDGRVERRRAGLALPARRTTGHLRRLRGEPVLAAGLRRTSATRRRRPRSASPRAAPARSRPPSPSTPPGTSSPGDEIVVRGAGFQPGTTTPSRCARRLAGQPENIFGCVSSDDDTHRIEGDGSFAREFEVPDAAASSANVTGTTMCSAEGDCAAGASADRDPREADQRDPLRRRRSGVHDPGRHLRPGQAVMPPQFPPAPVPVTIRRAGHTQSSCGSSSSSTMRAQVGHHQRASTRGAARGVVQRRAASAWSAPRPTGRGAGARRPARRRSR